MTSEGTLDGRYLEWLYSHIEPARSNVPSRSRWKFAHQLFTKPFTWSVEHDNNRLEDGIDLRREFLEYDGAERDKDWLELPCSCLELLIALSRRIVFETGSDDTYNWFWRLMINIGLEGYSDLSYNFAVEQRVNHALDTLMLRTYNYDGSGGGLFPLNHPDRDQRRVELWYQMSTYLLENGYG